jgi:hypothetical protein
MSDGKKKGGELEAELFARAYKDAEFRQRLIDDPRSAVEEFLEVELSSEVDVQLVQDGPNTTTLVMPYLPEGVADELSEDELADEILGTCSKAVYGGVLGTCSNSGTLWVNKA